MKIFFFIIILLIGTAFDFLIVPSILILCGKYSIESFFLKPPSATLEKLHYRYDAVDSLGESSMELTTCIKANNMVDNILDMIIEFNYQDGTPVLTASDRKPISIQRTIHLPTDKIQGSAEVTDVVCINYNLFPAEAMNGEDIYTNISLSYKNRKGEIEKHKQKKVVLLNGNKK